MDLVDKQNVIFIEIGQQGSKIACLFDGRTGGDADVDTHLVGNDTGQGGLTQTGRAVQQGVIQRFTPAAGGLNVNGQVALGLFLTGIIGKQLGAQSDFPRILRCKSRGNQRCIQLLGEF